MKVNIKQKVLAMVLGAVILPLLIITIQFVIEEGHVLEVVNEEIQTLALGGFERIAKDVYTLCESNDALVQDKLDSDLSVARTALQKLGAVAESNVQVEWQAVNQFSKASQSVMLPRLTVGGQWLGQNDEFNTESPIVDEVQKTVGGTCTIFQRMNDAGDMLRVSTNVKTLDGRRAIGTYIPAVEPGGARNQVVSAVLSGQTYRGRAYVVNAWYFTAYEPIYNDAGRVVGVLYVGVPESMLENIKKQLIKIEVGQSGYVYVVAGSGREKGTYIVSKDGARDGVNILNAKDADGNFFVQDIIKEAKAQDAGHVSFIRYQWKDEGQEESYTKIAAVTYFEPWDWAIGVGTNEAELLEAKERTESRMNVFMRGMMLTGLILAVVGGFLALIMANKMSGPVKKAMRMAQSIAEQDLNVEALNIESQDEVGDLSVALNDMSEKLRSMVKTLMEQTVSMASAAEEVTATSTQMAAGAQEQSSQAGEVAASVHQMAAAITENSQNATQTATLSMQANDKAKEGAEVMAIAQRGMEAIISTTEKTGTIVAALSDGAGQIGHIVEVINDIADQTNLLALNAAIEAARAGEQGRGFAVVADEVRKLAERTTKATAEISGMIQNIQHETVEASKAMAEAQESVSEGKASVEATEKVLAEIVHNVTMAMDMVQQIATASEEQSAAAEEIAANVSSISTVSQQSAAGSETLMMTANGMSQQAEALKNIVAQFKVD